MAIVTTDDKHYFEIAHRIRRALDLFPDDEQYLPEEMPDKVDEVYDAGASWGFADGYNYGYDDGFAIGFEEGGSQDRLDAAWDDGFDMGWDAGYENGYDEGYNDCEEFESEKWYQEGYQEAVSQLEPELEAAREEGKQSVYAEVEGINTQLLNIVSGTDTGGKSYYDAFWDTYQKNGNQTHYKSAFAGPCWTAELFKPKYDIIPNGTQTSYMMFYQSNIEGDLVELLKASGVTLDTSKVNGWVSYDFSNSKFTRLGKLDYSGASMLASAFSASKNLHTMDELIVSASTSFNGTFSECSALENLKISGTIAQNGLNLKDCTKLSKASIESVINALSTTTSGLSVTFSEVAIISAFGSKDSAEWTALKNTRSDWTIALA